eukprot:7690563-Lingulodinium_polyedra.AAC.1
MYLESRVRRMPRDCAASWLCRHPPRYRSRGLSMTALASLIGQDQSEHSAFHLALDVLINYVIEKGTRSMTFPWDNFERKVLELVEEAETRFEAPPDAYWEKAFYISQKGDPASNGLGHSVVTCLVTIS